MKASSASSASPSSRNHGEPPAELGHNRDFNIFWAGQALSVFGDACAAIATPLLVLQATGSVLKMGLLTAASGVGAFAAGLFSGVLVDRVDRRQVMIACDVVRTVLWSIVPLVWWLWGPHLWVLFLVSSVCACFGNAFQVACITALASIVRRDQIIRANGRLHGSYSLMLVLGPLVAGVISHALGPVTVIAVNAASFMTSALSLVVVRLRWRPDGAEPAAKKLTPQELLAGLRFIVKNPALRALTLLLGSANFLLGARNDVFIFHLAHRLHADHTATGIFFGVGGAGAIIGALIAPAGRERFGMGVFWIGCGFLMGAAVLGVSWAPTVAVASALAMLLWFGDTARGVVAQSFRQEITPDPMLGRVTAAFWSLINGPAPLGAALTTFIAARAGSETALRVMGLGLFALGVAGLFTALRAPIEMPPLPLLAEGDATRSTS